jgi:hypothetical protein
MALVMVVSLISLVIALWFLIKVFQESFMGGLALLALGIASYAGYHGAEVLGGLISLYFVVTRWKALRAPFIASLIAVAAWGAAGRWLILDMADRNQAAVQAVDQRR